MGRGGVCGANYRLTRTNFALVCPPKKSSDAAWLSEAEKGGSGVSPDYGNPTRAHAEEGQAERSGPG